VAIVSAEEEVQVYVQHIQLEQVLQVRLTLIYKKASSYWTSSRWTTPTNNWPHKWYIISMPIVHISECHSPPTQPIFLYYSFQQTM